jgi:hypothetical protein
MRLAASKATTAWNEGTTSLAPTCDAQNVSLMPIATGATVVDIDITEIYKQLLADPTNNFGICLTSPDLPNYFVFFHSREALTASNKPTILVEYRRPVFSSSNQP